MSENYSKTDLLHIAEELIENLRECEDGTRNTTRLLLRDAGYDIDEFDVYDLLDIHNALFRAARANHITLDISSHKDKEEGLPFNLFFVVHNKMAQVKCPYCGSKNTARIIYGYPVYSENLQRKLDQGMVSLGGCCVFSVDVNGEPVQTNPSRICNACKKKFGTPPLIISKDMRSAEDYRDVVTSIRFLVGGYFSGSTEVTITRNEKGAFVKVGDYRFGDKLPLNRDKQISPAKWNRILNTLYSQLYLHEWKKRYENPCVLDGTQWELKIKLTGNRVRNYYGSNDYPPYWKELTKIFREYSKVCV